MYKNSFKFASALGPKFYLYVLLPHIPPPLETALPGDITERPPWPLSALSIHCFITLPRLWFLILTSISLLKLNVCAGEANIYSFFLRDNLLEIQKKIMCFLISSDCLIFFPFWNRKNMENWMLDYLRLAFCQGNEEFISFSFPVYFFSMF